MSTTIDQRIVSMKFDNAGFSSGVKETLSDLRGLDRKLEQSNGGSALSGLQSSINSITFEKMAQNIDNIAGHFTVLGRAWDMTLGQMLYSASKWGLDTAKAMSVDNVGAGFEKFGQKTTSVSTLLSQGFDLDEIETQLEKLNWFSDETSYSFTDMVDNIAKFTASGQDLEDSSTALMGIANWAAMSGQNAQTASRAMYQLSQAMGAGVMRKQDYMSVQNANMDTRQFREMAIQAAMARGTLKELSKGVYKSTVGNKDDAFTIDQFTEQLTKGAWFTSDVMMDVYSQYAAAVDQIYNYVSDNDVDTTSQAIEQMEATGVAIDEFGKEAFLAAQQARTWTDVIDSVKDAASTGWMNIFGYIFGNTEETIDLFTDMANELWEVFVGPIATIADLMKEWYDFGGRTYLWEGLGTLWSNLTGILNAFGDALGIIFPIFEEGQGIVAADGTKAFADYMKSLSLTQEELTTLADTMAGLLLPLTWIIDLGKQVWAVIKPSLVGDLTGLLDYLGTKLQRLSSFFTGADESVKGFNGFIAGLVDELMRFLHGGFLDIFVDIVEFVDGRFAAAFTGLGKIFQFVKTQAEAFKAAVLDKLLKVFEAVSNRLSYAFDTVMRIPEAISFVWNALKNLATSIVETVKQFISFDKISKGIGTALSLLFGGLYLSITGTATLGDMLIGVGKNIKDFFVNLYTAFKSGGGIEGLFTALKEKIVTAFTGIKEGLGNYINVSTFVKIVANTFKYLNDSIAKLTGLNVGKIFKAIGSAAQKIIKPFSKLGFVIDGLKVFFDGLVESFKNFFDFKSLFETAKTSVGGFWTAIHNGITDAQSFSEVTSAVGKAFEGLGKAIYDKFIEKINIGGFFADAKGKALEFGKSIKDGIINMLTLGDSTSETEGFIDKLNGELTATADQIPFTGFQDLRKVIGLAKEALKEFANELGVKLKDKFQNVIDPLTKIGTAFKKLRDNITKALPNVKDITKKHVKLKGAVDDAVGAFTSFNDKFWEAFSGKKDMPKRIEELKKAIGELVDDVKKAVSENLDFTGWWEEFTAAFEGMKESFGQFFKEDFPKSFEDLTKGAEELWDAIKPYKEDTLWDALVNNVGNVKDAFSKAKENADGLVSALKETTVYQEAADSINAMVAAVEGTTAFKIVSEAIESVKNGIGDLVHTIKESDTGTKLAEIWGEFTASLGQTDWTTPSTAIASIATSFSTMLSSLNALRIEKLTEFVQTVDSTVEQALHSFDGLYNVYMYLKNFKENVKLVVQQGIEGFADGITSADWDSIIGRVMSVIGLVIIVKLLAMIDQIGETAGVIGAIAKNVKKFTGQLNSILMGTKWLFMAEMFKGLALAVIAIAGALFVLAAVPEDDLYKAVAAITAIILAFTLFAFVKGAFSKVKDSMSEANVVKDKIETLKDAIGTLADAVKEGLKKASLFFSIGFMIAAIGFVVVAFVWVIKELDLIEPKKFISGLLGIGMMLAVLVAVVGLLGLANKKFGNVSWETAATIVAIGVMLWLIVEAFKGLETLSVEGYSRGLSTMILMFFGLALVMAAIHLLPGQAEIYAACALIGSIVAFMILMMIPVNILATISKTGGLVAALVGISVLALVIVAVAGLTGLIAAFLKKADVDFLDFATVVASLVVVALVLVVVAGALLMLSTIPTDKVGAVEGMISVILVVLGVLFVALAIVAGILGKDSGMVKGLLAGAVALVLISAAIMVLAMAIGVIAAVCSDVASASGGDMISTLIGMVVALGVFIGVLVVLGAVVNYAGLKDDLITLSVTLLIISASILVLALAAGVLAQAAPAFIERFKEVGLTLLALAVAVLIFGAIGKIASGGLLAIGVAFASIAAVLIAVALAAMIFSAVIPESFDTTLNGMMAKADQIANVIALIIYALAVGAVRGIAAAIPPIIEALGVMLGQLWNLLVQGIGWIAQGLADWIENEGPKKLLHSIVFLGETLLAAILSMIGGIFAPISFLLDGLIEALQIDAKAHAEKAGFLTAEAATEGAQKGLDASDLDASKLTRITDETGERLLYQTQITGADNAAAYMNYFGGGLWPNPTQYANILLPQEVQDAALTANENLGRESAEAHGRTYDETMMATTAETTDKLTEQANAGGQSMAMAFGAGYESNTDALTAILSGTNFEAAGSMSSGPWTLQSDENMQALMNEYAANIPGLENVGGDINETMVGKLSEADTANAAQVNVDAYTDVLRKDGVSGAQSEATRMGVSGADALSATRGSYYNSSANVVAGAVQGIRDHMGSYIASVEEMALRAKEKYDQANVIGSPSKLFARSARWVVLGAVQGIKDNTGAYISSIVDMATNANKAFALTASDLSNFDFNSLDGQPTITPVLDMSNVQNGMSNVGSLLNGNMGTVTAGISFTTRMDEMNTYASQLAAASRQGNGTLLAAIERQTRRTEELITAVRQGGRIYLNGKTLVGGIIGDIDDGLGARTERWARGV